LLAWLAMKGVFNGRTDLEMGMGKWKTFYC